MSKMKKGAETGFFDADYKTLCVGDKVKRLTDNAEGIITVYQTIKLGDGSTDKLANGKWVLTAAWNELPEEQKVETEKKERKPRAPRAVSAAPALETIKTEDLVAELKRRGYKGTLTRIEEIEL